jgi:3-oxoacyl-[acyl-carrier protein] reductase
MTPITLDGKVAVVLGGTGGLGGAIAGGLAEAGAAVVPTGRDPERVKRAVAAIHERGARSLACPCDVTDEAALRTLLDEVTDAFGRVDVLVNAAGVAAGGRLEDDKYAGEWERALAVNLTGAMTTVRACLDDLLASDAGRIVNVASTEGLAAARGLGPYVASKHALIGFTRSLAVDLGRRGVTANAVCPGATLTGMTEVIPAADRDTYARRAIPLGRYARPEEIAHMIAALAAPEASFVNGAVIPVDGGMTAMAH